VAVVGAAPGPSGATSAPGLGLLVLVEARKLGSEVVVGKVVVGSSADRMRWVAVKAAAWGVEQGPEAAAAVVALLVAETLVVALVVEEARASPRDSVVASVVASPVAASEGVQRVAALEAAAVAELAAE